MVGVWSKPLPCLGNEMSVLTLFMSGEINECTDSPTHDGVVENKHMKFYDLLTAALLFILLVIAGYFILCFASILLPWDGYSQ